MLEVKIEDEAIGIKKGACHREQFVNKSSFGLTGIVLRHIIRKIVFIGEIGACHCEQASFKLGFCPNIINII